MPAEGFKGHVATDGSLLGTVGKWKACCWAVVQMDYDEEMEPHVWLNVGSIWGPAHHQEGGADSLLVPSQKMSGLIKVHVDNKGIIVGYVRRSERKSVLSQEQEMQTCG